MFKRLKKTLKQRGGVWGEGKRRFFPGNNKDNENNENNKNNEDNEDNEREPKRIKYNLSFLAVTDENPSKENSSDIIMEKPAITKATYYKQFAFSEWIHDWWNGYRNKDGGKEINFIIFEALVRTLEKSTIKIDDYKTNDLDDEALKERLKQISNITNELMTEFYKKFSPNAHITVSTIEDSTITAFEDAVEYLSRPSPNAIISYEELFSYGNNLSTKMIEKRNEFRSITLDPVNYNVKDLTEPQKITIRNAIKVFMTGEADLTKQGPFYLTFDAAGKDVTKIFLGDENTFGLIMPANIADSATSSIKKIGKNENYFYFPTNPTSEENTSLTDNYTIEFEDKGFSPLTPFAFDYVIKREGVEICRSSFGDKITQGPSLDTLMTNHILAYNDEDFRHSGSSGCLDIAANFTEDSVANVKADVKSGKSIFQTAKMRGDYDQAKQLREAQKSIGSGTFILVSADREEILTRRLHKGEAILHYGGTFTLYRTDTRLDPAAVAAYNAAKTAKFVADNTDLYNKIYTMLSEKIDVFIANLPRYPSKVPIVTTLFSNRIADITAYLTNIKSIELPKKEEAPTEENIKTLFGTFEASGIPISSLIYLSKYTPPVVAPKNKVYPFLNFSLDDYNTLEKQIRAARATMTSTRPVRIPEDFFNHVTQKEGYAESVDTILESFFDISYVSDDTIKKLKLPTPDQSNQDIITTFIEADKKFNKISIASRSIELINSHRGLRSDATEASTALRKQLNDHFIIADLKAAAGGGSRQRGGAKPTQEVLDVVLEVLKEASIFFNQRNRDIERDVVTIANDNGKKTVSSIKAEKDRKPLIELINSISPSDAATHAGDLLNRLNEIPGGDPTINYIKILLNPFNDDANGYINEGHPIAANMSLGYATKNGATEPKNYFLGNIIERPILQKTRSVSKLLEPLKVEYSMYYDMLPSISDTKPTDNAKTYRELLEEGQFSEYIKAVYYAQIDGLITLAILNDLIERNFAENKSLLFNYLPKLGDRIPKIDITTDGGWVAIPGKLQALFMCVVDGEIPHVVLSLLSGGKRTNRKTRRRNKNNKTTKNTKRQTRRRKD